MTRWAELTFSLTNPRPCFPYHRSKVLDAIENTLVQLSCTSPTHSIYVCNGQHDSITGREERESSGCGGGGGGGGGEVVGLAVTITKKECLAEVFQVWDGGVGRGVSQPE